MMKKLDKENKPTISVLTPVYNTRKYLNTCIKSLLNQMFMDFEIIALNDGSTDGSQVLLEQLAYEDNRIRVVHKTNSGYGDTMNLGINMARGKYIAILESDDYAEAEMLKVLYDKAEQMNADLVLANYFMECVDEDGLSIIKTEVVENLAKVNYEVYLTEEERKRLACTTPALWRGLYKKDYLIRENINFLPTPSAAFQDTSFFIKAVMMTEKAVHISNKVLHYRRGQVCASVKDVGKVYCICDELEEVTRYISEKKRYSWYSVFPLILYIKYLWNFKRLSEPAKSEFIQKFKIEMIVMDLNGWLDKSIWPEWRYKQMIELLDYEKIRPLKKRRIKNMDANQRAKLNRFIATLTLYDEVVLYGAGTYGDIVLQRIYDWCLYKKIKFAVTGEPKERIHKGIDVLPIEYYKNCKDNYVIVISVGVTLTDEMAKTLDILGIRNYIILDDDLRRVLKEDPGMQESKILREQIKFARESLKKEEEKTELVKKTLFSEREQTKELKKTLDNERERTKEIRKILDDERERTKEIRKALDDERERTKEIKEELRKEKEQINHVKKTNDLLNNMLGRIRDENELLRESYMKVNQLEKRMDKLETFMREEEVCRLNTDKILKLMNDTNQV